MENRSHGEATYLLTIGKDITILGLEFYNSGANRMKNQNEEEIHGRVFNFVIITVRYFETCWAILVHPARTFANYDSRALTKPGTFLVINIVISYSVGYIFGYELPRFPFDVPLLQSPILQKIVGNYPFVIIRFVLGLLIFLSLLNWLLKYKNLRSFTSLIFPILCYGSVIYLPFILIKQSASIYFSYVFAEVLSGPGISLAINLKLLFYVAIRIALVVWWLWLIYLGTRFLMKKTQIKKVIILSFILFYVIQISGTSLTLLILNRSTIKNTIKISLDELKGGLYMSPPNYFKAYIFAKEVSDNKVFIEYIRYVYKLKKIVYTLASYKVDDELISTARKSLKERDYYHLHQILNDELTNYSSEENIQKPIYYALIRQDLDEAERLRNSPTFIELQGKLIHINLSLFFSFNPFYEPISSINPQKTIVTIKFPIPAHLISLVP